MHSQALNSLHYGSQAYDDEDGSYRVCLEVSDGNDGPLSYRQEALLGKSSWLKSTLIPTY